MQIRRSKHVIRALGTKLVFALVVFFAASGAAFAKTSLSSGYEALSKEQRATLDELEQRTFEYFRDTANTANGQMPDHFPIASADDNFSSVAAIGFGLTAYGIGVERGWMKRDEAARRTLAALKFFHDTPQGDQPDESGNHGFFYHFLDMNTGKRFKSASHVELSSIDTSWLLYGVLFAQSYYDRNNKDEKEIRQLSDDIFGRVDWKWFSDGNPLMQAGWTPENGFDYNYYRGYSEAIGLYILALGSPTPAFALGQQTRKRWTQFLDRSWGEFQGQTFLNGGPLFWHQYTHAWIDFRGIQDEYMRGKGIDYFINAKRATLAQREYAIHNPLQWKDYGADIWGLTACNGPRGDQKPGEPDRYAKDPKTFYAYIARGAGLRYAVDDGTIAPAAAIASIAFTPEFVLPVIDAMKNRYAADVYTNYGFVDAFNPSFTFTDRTLRTGKVVPGKGWFDTTYIGIDQGPIVLMLENYRSEFVWKTMSKNPHIRAGLKNAGFTGGWLDGQRGTRTRGE